MEESVRKKVVYRHNLKGQLAAGIHHSQIDSGALVWIWMHISIDGWIHMRVYVDRGMVKDARVQISRSEAGSVGQSSGVVHPIPAGGRREGSGTFSDAKEEVSRAVYTSVRITKRTTLTGRGDRFWGRGSICSNPPKQSQNEKKSLLKFYFNSPLLSSLYFCLSIYIFNEIQIFFVHVFDTSYPTACKSHAYGQCVDSSVLIGRVVPWAIEILYTRWSEKRHARMTSPATQQAPPPYSWTDVRTLKSEGTRSTDGLPGVVPSRTRTLRLGGEKGG